MSYILDALRRADAERDRGAVPGLHAQPLPLVSSDTEPRRGLPPIAWLGLGGASLIAAVLAWRLLGGETPAPAPLPSPRAAEAQSPSAAPTQPTTPAITAAPSTTAAPRVTVKAPPAPPPAASSQRPAAAAKMPTTAPGEAPATANEAAPAAFGSAASAATAAHIPSANELPPEVRQNLPKLAIGGSMYSESPANRMLIINGLIYHENDRVAPDLTLESIQLKSAVLRYRGYRYSINY